MAESNEPAWPQHSDGRNKTIAEMTAKERDAQFKASGERYRTRRSAATLPEEEQ